MKPKRREARQRGQAAHIGRLSKQPERNDGTLDWPGDHFRYLTITGIVLIAICTVIIYGQIVRLPPIDYEDPFYLVRSPFVHTNPAFFRLFAVWNEPYFANFHPVTTTTWLMDRAFADKSKPFDGLP
ncbi:MAG: hypothetical protein WA609_05330, partial [Terriglobales bacterium]